MSKPEPVFTDAEVEAMGLDLSPDQYGHLPAQLDYNGTMLYPVDGNWYTAPDARFLAQPMVVPDR